MLFRSVLVIVFAMWIFSIMQFSKAAEKQRGRWLPIVEYHIAGLLALPCFVWSMGSCNEISQGRINATVLLWLLLAVVGLFACVLIYSDARRRVAHLRIVRDTKKVSG